jgi:hypothetical protein
MLNIKYQVEKALLGTEVDFEALNKKGDSEFACVRHEKSNQMSVPTQCPQVLIRTCILKAKNKNKITRVLNRMLKLSKIKVRSV